MFKLKKKKIDHVILHEQNITKLSVTDWAHRGEQIVVAGPLMHWTEPT